ncbi:MAG: TonB-dependent receptor domain-containing protein [Polyangiaceae bacterium]
MQRVVRSAPAAMAVLAAARGALAQQTEVQVRGDSAGNWTSRADERDSSRELTDAASLVEPLPGVYVRRFGGDDSFATLSIRGTSSSEVAVILAGVPLTGGADPSLDLATLPLWPGAVARVHRSFAPAALGPGSLGGTLVIDPPRATAPAATDAWAAVGSFGEARLRVGNVSDVGGGARVATALSASRSDGDFSYYNPLLSTPGHDVSTTLENAGHAAANGLASLALPVRWGHANDGALTVTMLAQDRRQQLPGTVIGPTPFSSLDSDRQLASAELTGTAGPGAWSARAWGRRDGLHLRDPLESAILGPTSADQTIAAVGGSVGWRGHPASGAMLEAHVDGSGERFEPGEYVGAASPPGATRASVGTALDAEWRPATELTVAGSGRVDGWADAASDGTSDHEVRPTGHIGIEAPLDAVTLAAHGGATGRPPSFVELYGDRGAFIGDPSLHPESAWTVDAGGRLSEGHDRLRMAIELVTFATWADDLITFVPTGAYGRSKATNIGRARMLGAEVDGRAQAGPVELRVSYTALAAENESACTAVVGPCEHPPLPARPANDVVADAIVHHGPASVRAGVDAITGMFADLAGSIPVPPRVLASVGARVDVVRGVRLAVDVRNLFDVRTGTYGGALGPVREPIGDYYEYPLPGRSVLFTARFSDPPAEAR